MLTMGPNAVRMMQTSVTNSFRAQTMQCGVALLGAGCLRIVQLLVVRPCGLVISGVRSRFVSVAGNSQLAPLMETQTLQQIMAAAAQHGTP